MPTAEPTTAPPGYLEITDLNHVPYRKLADRRAWLLNAISSAGPGADHHGVRAAAIVLPAVLTELDMRSRTYKFSCIGLAAFDHHMDNYPPEAPDSHAHQEL